MYRIRRNQESNLRYDHINAPVRDNYHNSGNRKEYHLFNQDYFSGADMHIYFGDIWVDEITSMQFSLDEQVHPIYGYNSYTYDTIVRGVRAVSGTFRMNFKSVGYLQQIIEHAEAINHFLEEGNEGRPVDIKYFDKYRLDEVLEIYGKESFDQIADEYEEAIWGVNKEWGEEYLNYGDEPYFQESGSNGFDIKINYGPVQETKMRDKVLYSQLGPKSMQNLTVEIINGVQITGVMRNASTGDQGEPLQETYNFIARDLNAAPLVD